MIFDVPSIIRVPERQPTPSCGHNNPDRNPSRGRNGGEPSSLAQSGDRVSIVVERIGKLTNPVESEPLLLPVPTTIALRDRPAISPGASGLSVSASFGTVGNVAVLRARSSSKQWPRRDRPECLEAAASGRR